MTIPIEISDLTPASLINRATDLLVLRQGLSDKKATVAQIANISLSDYPILSSEINLTDVFLMGRNDGLGNYTNYLTNINRFGFLKGVKSWFYDSVAPIGWSIVANTGDKVLGTILNGGNTYQYNNFGIQGNWQQQDVDGIVGRGLSIQQMPNHQHFGQFGRGRSDLNARFIAGAETEAVSPDPRYGSQQILGVIGGTGDVPSHDAFGACDPHSHGDKWRPEACVGIICEKMD